MLTKFFNNNNTVFFPVCTRDVYKQIHFQSINCKTADDAADNVKLIKFKSTSLIRVTNV